MLNKILELKSTNKILFWVLLPIVIIAFVVKFLSSNNIEGAKEDLQEAEKTDEVLRNEQEELNNEADKLVAEVKNNTEVDENWHKDV